MPSGWPTTRSARSGFAWATWPEPRTRSARPTRSAPSLSPGWHCSCSPGGRRRRRPVVWPGAWPAPATSRSTGSPGPASCPLRSRSRWRSTTSTRPWPPLPSWRRSPPTSTSPPSPPRRCRRAVRSRSTAATDRRHVATSRGPSRLWRDLGFPYETARSRVALGRAHLLTGDDDLARIDLGAARTDVRSVGGGSRPPCRRRAPAHHRAAGWGPGAGHQDLHVHRHRHVHRPGGAHR